MYVLSHVSMSWPKIEKASGADSWSGEILFRPHNCPRRLAPGEVTLGTIEPHHQHLPTTPRLSKYFTVTAPNYSTSKPSKSQHLFDMASAGVLRQDHILDLAVRAIQPAGDTQPSLKTPYEAVALIGHACMVAVGFRLVGLSENHNIGILCQYRKLNR
jgi:hypothetical protein